MFHHPEHLLKKSGSPSHSKEGRRRKKPQVNENQFSFLPPFLFFLLPFSEQKSDKLVAPSLQQSWDKEVRADMETDPPWRPWVCLPAVSGAQSRPVPRGHSHESSGPRGVSGKDSEEFMGGRACPHGQQ